MKKILIISILITAIQLVTAQKNDTIYYDANWKGVQVKTLATFMRIVYTQKDSQNSKTTKDFYITGELQSEGFIPVYIDKSDDKKSKFKGHVISYYKSGKKESETYRNDSCKFEGEQTIYYENGTKKSNLTYKNGQLEGEYTNYFQNGLKMSTGTFKNGQNDGEFTEYYANGNKKQIINYQKDLLPEATNYDEKGIKLSKGTIKDGQWEGEYTDYYENGSRKSKGILKNGKWQGTFYQFNLDGSYCENEWIDGVAKNDYVTLVNLEGKRIKIKNNTKK